MPLKDSIYRGLTAVSIFVLLIIFFLTAFISYELFYKPLVISNTSQSIIKIDKNSSAYSLIHTLKTRNFIRSEKLFLTLMQLQGFTQQLKAGVYQIQVGESAQHFLLRVVNGDVLKKEFRIIEGTTQSQISKNLSNAEYLNYQENDWNLVSKGLNNAEGMLLADTYQYNAGSDSKTLLNQAKTNLQKFLDSSWQTRTPELPYRNPYELLIAASIIEKEAANPIEKRLVSGVIVNRLRKNMPLQMDPTVIYALGDTYTGSLSKANLKFDSPYNSYLHRGLPPTPIAMVSKEDIEAAAHPANTNYLYFVARGDGTHDFSVTYEQQKMAITRYKKNKENQ